MFSTLFALALVLSFSLATATPVAGEASTTPMQGPLAIEVNPPDTPGLSFDPVPWVSPSGLQEVCLWPFLGGTTVDDVSGKGPGFCLAEARFQAGDINVTGVTCIRTDYLGIRIGNYAGMEVTLGATVLTLDISEQGEFPVYLPEFTFVGGDNVFFWVATDGSTYYAHSSKGPGLPDLLPAAAMTENNLAASPPVQYDLTIASTAGGSVTDPGEGTFTYYCGTVVDLVASPDAGYKFVNWSGDVATVADVHDASTTITMQGYYTIGPNFDKVEDPLDPDYDPWEGEEPEEPEEPRGPPFGGCSIATAAYGTSTAEQIDVLREFRDVVLLESAVGSQFVALYYQLSPPVADFIARNEMLRTLVRELMVDPVVWIVETTGDMWRMP